MQTPHLTVGNIGLMLSKRFRGQIDFLDQRKKSAGIIGICLKVPAVVEHIFGDPLIGKVFQ